MTLKQLQSLIASGMFSATLLAGVAYADEAPAADTTTVDASTTTVTPKHAKKEKKSTTTHDCAGQSGCEGKGGCSSK